MPEGVYWDVRAVLYLTQMLLARRLPSIGVKLPRGGDDDRISAVIWGVLEN